jgi:phosphoserine phosphatase RsbU/P
MTRLGNVRRGLFHGHLLRRHWLDFQREARSSLGSFAPELPPGSLEKGGWVRVWPFFARAMFLRLTPARRLLLLAAILMLVSSLFISGGQAQNASSNRLLLAAVCLLVLSALELADRVALKRDLEVARDIQEWLVPHAPPDLPGLDIAFATRPDNIVAGDYYDVLSLSGTAGASPAVLFVVADVAGKGIPAGLLMACFRTCLRTLANTIYDLADLIAPLHRSCCADSNGGQRFTTAFLAQYDTATRSLFYVNAGHNPPLLRRASGCIEQLEAGGPPFGTFADAVYDIGRVQTAPGDLLLMYTDGVVEAVKETGDEYGLDRLRAFVRDTAASSAECQQQLFAAIDAFTAGTSQHDDITCLIVQFSGEDTCRSAGRVPIELQPSGETLPRKPM